MRGGGTGSSPQGPKGRHLKSRLKVSHEPYQGPCTLTASMQYREQLGLNRQHPAKRGESVIW